MSTLQELIGKDDFAAVTNNLSAEEVELITTLVYDYETFAYAIGLAAHAHRGQVRKGDPIHYFIHPLRVALAVYKWAGEYTPMVSAALLHDVVEDTDCDYWMTYDEVEDRNVMKLVQEMTEVKISGNRKLRKEYEARRLSCVSPDGQTLKCFDIIDNARSPFGDDKFAHLWLGEKAILLEHLTKADTAILAEAKNAVQTALRNLTNGEEQC